MRLPHALPLLLTLTPLPASCGGSTDAGAGTAGRGIVVLTENPEHHEVPPEELLAQGIRPHFHDFGRVPVGDKAQHVFRLRNDDPEPVTITRMQPECGCTKPVIQYTSADGELVRGNPDPRAKKVITLPPGVVAELYFNLDTGKVRYTNRDELYTVQIATDSPNRRFFALETHIFVEDAFQATPMPIDLKRISRNGGGRGTSDIIQAGGVGARLLRIGDVDPGLEARLEANETLGREFWTLHVEVPPPLEPGPLVRKLQILTEDANGNPYRPLEATVIAMVVEDVDWTPLRLIARGTTLAEGGQREAEVEVYSLVPDDWLRIVTGRIEGDGADKLELTLTPGYVDQVRGSERWTVTLRLNEPSEEILRGKVILSIEGKPDAAIEYGFYPR